MPVYEYRALQLDGRISEGHLDADGRQEAFRQLEAAGLRPIRLVERGGADNNRKPASDSRWIGGMRGESVRILAWAAAGLFVFSLFLPAVDMTPWLPGFNLLVLSFGGTVVFGLASVSDGARIGDWSFGFCLLRWVICFAGASANVLMITTFFRIIRGRRVPVPITALTLALTLAAAGGLCYLSDRSVDETLSYGYFAWAACAALMLAASIFQLED